MGWKYGVVVEGSSERRLVGESFFIFCKKFGFFVGGNEWSFLIGVKRIFVFEIDYFGISMGVVLE